MAKGKAYCDQIGANVTITEAREFYFSQPIPRKKLTFKCGDDRCRPISRAAVVGANYHKEDDPTQKIVSPYFRENSHYAHIATCTWLSENGRYRDDSTEQYNSRTSAATSEAGLIFRAFPRKGKAKLALLPPLFGIDDEGTQDVQKTSSGSSGKRKRPETSRFMATVAMNHLCLTVAQRRTTRLGIESVAQGSFFDICTLIRDFDSNKQSQRIYFGRCKVESLKVVFLIRFFAKIDLHESAPRISAEVKLRKDILQKEDVTLSMLLEQLASEDKIAWCYFYSTTPPVETSALGKTVARFEVADLDHLAVIPADELTHPQPPGQDDE